MSSIGFEVGRFIGLERIVEKTKESYYNTLYQSPQDWHEGKHDLLPWTEYSLGVLTAAYREFEQRVGTKIGARGAKTEIVLQAFDRMPGEFRMTEIERLCPNVTGEMIRAVPNQLKSVGKVESAGRGPGALWRK